MTSSHGPGERTAADFPCVVGGTPDRPHRHSVQFYETDAALINEVGGFIGAALEAGDVAVVIATNGHRAALDEWLRARGVDVAHVFAQRRYVSFDAHETLSTCVPDGWPDASRFVDLVGDIVARAMLATANDHPRIVVFGELVALLVEQGRYEAAIHLEELWNDLAAMYGFSLHCAYPIGSFDRVEHGDSLEKIFAAHSRVMPAESYSSLSDDEQRLRTITRLQQKARALETEIEERRHVQRSLRRRQAELTDLLENALDGVQQIDPDQTIRWANRTQLRLLGYAAEEYVGHPFGQFLTDARDFAGVWQQLTRREDVDGYPAELRCKDGSVKQVLISANGLWEDDRFVHARCVIHDVTDQMRMEEALRERNRELSAAVAARDKFLSVAAHELKTPLTSLRLFAQLLLRDVRRGQAFGSGRLEPALAAIELQTGKLSRLLSRLLDATDIETGQLRIDPARTDLAALVRAGVERQHVDAGHTLVLEGPEHLAAVVDPGRFAQVVANLLDNAVKFSPEGGTVTVALDRDDAGGIRLSVTDHGVGVPPDQREAVFNRYHQAHAEPHLSGMGLGLYITREIVGLHGGCVHFEEPGHQGARVVVSFPPSAAGAQIESIA